VALPLVAIVGAPNVGKSTLFNRLVGRRTAIVTDEPGMTRDRLYEEVEDAPRPFRLVDTGGLTPDTAAPFASEITQQADAAMGEARVILFIVDARAGVTAIDREVAELLRRRSVPLLLVANKIDSPKVAHLVNELFDLGLGDPVPISAEHGLGIDELLDRIDEQIGPDKDADDREEDERDLLSLAIVGRPNVGKSSLLNRLVGQERVMVSDVPGTTRDAVDTLLTINGRRYRLIDTAGIRRRGRVQRKAEHFSVVRARKNIERCGVAILVLDADAGFAAQDAHIAGYIRDAFKPIVVAINKWDLVAEREAAAKHWKEVVQRRLRFLKQVPVVLISAKSGQRVIKLLDHVDEQWALSGQRLSTPQLNRWLQEAAAPALAAPSRGRSLRLYYATQTGVHPPSFVLFCNDTRLLHFSFKRYLENTLRDRFSFGGSPIRLQFRSRREGKKR
jgi:GTP-binding protein